MMFKYKSAFLLFFLTLASSQPLQAFTPAEVESFNPAQADPGRVDENFRPIKLPEKAPQLKEEKEEQPLVESKLDLATFRLETVEIENATAYTLEELSELYQDFIGKEVNVEDLGKIAARITKRYRKDAYVLSQAYLPEQEISEGKVRIAVLEGFIDHVEKEGVEIPDSPIIDKTIQKIISMRPLNIKKLERYSLLLNDLAGISVRSVVSPNETTHKAPGSATLKLIFERKDFDFAFSADNTGSKFAGPVLLSFLASGSNLALPFSKASLNFMGSAGMKELLLYSFSHKTALNSEGSVFTLSASQSRTQPGDSLKNANVDGLSNNYVLSFSHPFARSRAENLSLSLDFSWKDNQSEASNQFIFKDKIRSLKAAFSYDLVDRFKGLSLITFSATKGFNILGAKAGVPGSINPSRQGAKASFAKCNMTLARLQQIKQHWQAFASMSAQYANEKLFSSEEIGYGGMQFGRAYDASEITGDRGILAAIELRYSGLPEFYSLKSQVLAFYDLGKVWRFRQNGITGDNRRPMGQSTGLAMRMNYKEALSASLTLAQPIARLVSNPQYGNGDEPRLILSLNARY